MRWSGGPATASRLQTTLSTQSVPEMVAGFLVFWINGPTSKEAHIFFYCGADVAKFPLLPHPLVSECFPVHWPGARASPRDVGHSSAATSAFLKALEQQILSDFRRRGLWNLNKEDGTKPFEFEIDLYERGSHYGGRLDYAVIDGNVVETGGADIEETNLWLSTFHKMLNSHLSEKGNKAAADEDVGSSGDTAGPMPLAEFESSVTRTFLITRDNRVHDVSIPAFFLAIRGNGQGILELMQDTQRGWKSLYSKLAGIPLCVYVTRDLFLQPGFEHGSGEKYEELCAAPKGFTSGLEMVDSVGMKPLTEKTFATRAAETGLTRDGMDFMSGVTRSIYSQDLEEINAAAGIIAMLGSVGSFFQGKRYSGRVLVEYLIARFTSNAFLNCGIRDVLEEPQAGARQVTKSRKRYKLRPRLEGNSCTAEAQRRLESVLYDFVVVAAPLELSGVRVYRHREDSWKEGERTRSETSALERVTVPPKSWRTVHLVYFVADAIRWTSSPSVTSEEGSRSGDMSRLILKARPSGAAASAFPEFYVAGCYGHAAEDAGQDVFRRKVPLDKTAMDVDVGESPRDSTAPQESGDVAPGKKTLCRVASPQWLTNETLESTFVNPQHIYRRRWLAAYPIAAPFDLVSTSAAAEQFSSSASSAQAFILNAPSSEHATRKRTTTQRAVPEQSNFILADNVFCPSAFESIFSSMEGQAVSAQNAVNLISNSLDIYSGEV
ncbi:UNVERIFIED_CONTAM: hypothetical protein HHA_248990 [Hammondia hammondi]|eukprot:XP_008883913.1 hypothetical protein HHA_248990 [Hammondia hammondi]